MLNYTRSLLRSLEPISSKLLSTSTTPTTIRMLCLNSGRTLLQYHDEPNNNHRPYTIVVEGNIGSGKTTFLNSLKSSLNYSGDQMEVLAEPVNKWTNLKGHNILELMYQDPKRYSFLFQTYVQLTMLKFHTNPTLKSVRIMERSLLSARYCFIENLYDQHKLSDVEYSVLSEWFNFLITSSSYNFKIDLIVYLRTSPEIAYQRILKRQRKEETSIPFKYVKDLHDLHEDWLGRRTKFQPLPAPVLTIDCDRDLNDMLTEYRIKEKEIFKNSPLSRIRN